MALDPLLLVEDDDNDVYFMKRALKRAGITQPLQIAEDGQKALDYLSGRGDYADRKRFPLPALVFLDLRLPFMPGLEILRWIREQPNLRTLIVIILTSSKEDADIDQAYRRGANAYLVKPSDADELLAMVEDVRNFWLRQNQAPPAPSAAWSETAGPSRRDA